MTCLSDTASNTQLTQKIVDAIDAVVGGKCDQFVPLHEPVFSGRERDYVLDAIDSTFVSSVGSYVDRLERELADYCGVTRAVVTVNGTASLHVCLLLAGVRPGDEVIIPTLTFVATANAVTYAGAVPHLADSEERTLGLDPDKLSEHLNNIAALSEGQCRNKETGRRIAAIVPMHTFGHPVRMHELLQVAAQWSIPLVEDAAESLGSTYGGRQTGSFGMVNAVSFNGNKIMTTGGGGAILTQDEKLADRAKHLTTTAKIPHRWNYEHDAVGYNYRMPNLNAALGVAQLEQMPVFLRKKRELATKYAEVFSKVEGVQFMNEPEGCESNYWLNAILLDPGREDAFAHILKTTHDQNIMTRPAWLPMHKMRLYSHCPRMALDVAENLATRLINIPSSSYLGTGS
jgi:perosamine synthetase